MPNFIELCQEILQVKNFFRKQKNLENFSRFFQFYEKIITFY